MIRYFVLGWLLLGSQLLSAQTDLLKYVNKNVYPILELKDHLPVDFKWPTESQLQVKLNEGITALDENAISIALTHFGDYLAMDSAHWVAYYYRAICYKKLDSIDRSIADLEKAKTINPNQVEILFELGENYQAKKQFITANDLFKKALKINPHFGHAYYGLASSAYLVGDRKTALVWYKKCHEKAPNFADAYMMHGVLLSLNKKDYQKALALFDKAIEIDPDNALSYFWRGISYVNNLAYKDCLNDWNVYIQRNPNDGFMLLMRGYLQIEMGLYDAAFVDFRKAVLSRDIDESNFIGAQTTLDKQIDIQNASRYIMRHGYGLREDAFTLIKKSYCQLITGTLKNALESVDQSLKIEISAVGLYLKAIILEQLGEHYKAFSTYHLALQYDGEIFDALKKRGIYRAELKDTLGAYKDFARMIELQPDVIMTYRLRGFTKASNQNYKGAIEDLTKVVEHGLTDFDVLLNLGVSYLEVKDTTQGIFYLKEALLFPTSNELSFRLVIEKCLEYGDTTTAEAGIQYAINNYPEFRPYYLQLAEIKIHQQEWETALKYINAVIQFKQPPGRYTLSNNDLILNAYYLRGTLYLKQGNLKLAIRDLTTSLSIANGDRYKLVLSKLVEAHKLKGNVKTARALEQSLSQI
jgi:tetratricopeptide (TPR) repeat protein